MWHSGEKSACQWRTQVWSLSWVDPLEKEMATHSSILTWGIPWTKEPGKLQSMGLQRVGHDLARMQNKAMLNYNYIKPFTQLIHAFKNFPFHWSHVGTSGLHNTWNSLSLSVYKRQASHYCFPFSWPLKNIQSWPQEVVLNSFNYSLHGKLTFHNNADPWFSKWWFCTHSMLGSVPGTWW